METSWMKRLFVGLAAVSGLLFPVYSRAAEVTARYVRLTVSDWPRTAGGIGLSHANSGLAIGEFELRTGADCGTKVAWPEGTSLTSDPNKTDNEGKAQIWDGVYDGSKYYNGAAGSDGNYTFTFSLGAPVTFSGYAIYGSDADGRSPVAWTLATSEDGATWRTVDVRTLTLPQVKGWRYTVEKKFALRTARRTVSGAEAWEQAGAWQQEADDGTTAAVDKPEPGVPVVVTVTGAASLAIDEAALPLSLGSLSVEGEGTLALNFGHLGMADADYLSLPMSKTLLTSTGPLPAELRLQLAPLKYGAYAVLQNTGAAVVATVQPPHNVWWEEGAGDGLISINFSHGDTGKLTGASDVGLAGYETNVANWDNFSTAAATNQALHLRTFTERTVAQAGTELSSALTYTSYGTYGDAQVPANSLQRGYLDDDGTSLTSTGTLSIQLPVAWTKYTAVIYSSTDSANFPFFARRINGDWYTYNSAGALEKMSVAEGATTPDLTAGQWGSATKRGTYEEGGNVMVVPGLTGNTFNLWFPGGYVVRGNSISGGRGCLAALQLIQETSYALDRVVTRIATAPAGTVAWGSLTWVDENGDPAAAPTAADAAAVVLTGETVLTATTTDVAPQFLTLYGNGHAVTLPAEADFAPGGWAFVSDTTVVLPTAEHALPTTLASYPRRVRYDYFYEGELTLLPRYEQAFTTGFSGALTPQGGLAEFTGGSVTVTALATNTSGSTLVFSGDSVVTVADGLAIGSGALIFRDQAQVTVSALELLKNAAGGSATLTIEDEAQVTVTGRVATLAASNGTSAVYLAGQGKLLAKQAELSLCGAAAATSGSYSLQLADEAELWVKGLKTTSSAASVPVLTLAGGRLMLGSAGLAATGTQQVAIDWSPAAKLGAWEDCELSSAAGFCSALTGLETLTLASEPEATLTFTSLAPFFLQPAAATYLYAPWAGNPSHTSTRAKGFTFQIDDLVYPADLVGASQITVTQIAVCTTTSTGLGRAYGVLVDEGSNRVLAITSGLSTVLAGTVNNYPPRDGNSHASSMADFPFASGVTLMRGKQYTVWPVASTAGIVVGAEMPADAKASAGLTPSAVGLIADSTATADGRALHPSVRLLRTGEMIEQVQVQSGKVAFRGAAMTVLPALTVADGCALTLADCAPEMPSVAMGNETTLTLAGSTPVLQSITFGQKCVIRVPMGESMAQSGYLEMAAGQAMPDFSEVIFTFVLDSARSGGKTLFPLLPLALAACDEAATPAVRGYAVVNNTNNAIGSATFAYRSALLGQGLYVQFSGNDVFSQHTVELTKSAEGEGYPLLQSTVDAFPYHLFEGKVAGARLLIPDGGIRLPHASFSGTSIRVVAQGDALAPLLVTEDATFSTPVTFDLSRWGEAFAAQLTRGAVKDVPVSFCLMSGTIRTTALADFTVDFGGYTLPAGYTAAVEVGENGLYYVVYSTQKVRTVSVNFSERTRTFDGAATGVYTLPVAAWNNFEGNFSSSVLLLSTRVGSQAGQAKDGELPMVLLASASAMNVDAEQPVPLLQSRLEDGLAQTIRISSMPFEAYRVALIFANDLGGAAYGPVTVNGVVYAMDGAGYTRRAVAGDEGWGTTNRPTADMPIRLGRNALVTDTLTARQVELALPALEYAVRYAGVAAIQVIEAPLPAENLPPARTYTATLPEGEVAWESLTFTITEDANADAGETTGPWVSGEQNTLRLLCAGSSVLTLPDGFMSSAIRFPNPADDGTSETPPAPTGALVLNAPGSLDVGLLNASGLKDLTLTCPCTGVDVSAPVGTLRIEAAFDNNGQTYTIADGQTLSLGENCGIVTSLDDNGTASLTINRASTGTLRRDYPVTQTTSQAAPDLTCAFKKGVIKNTNNSTYRFLIEAGDRLQNLGQFHPPVKKDWVYTQTGGYASFEDNGGVGGILLPNNNGDPDKTMTLNISGRSDSRLETTKIWAWRTGTVVNINVSGEATLALGSGGLRKGEGRSISAIFTEQGTLELMAATCENGAGTDCTVTFHGGCLTTQVAESNCQLPLLFTGTADQPTVIAPKAASTILLSAAAPSTPAEAGVVHVTQGTLAVSNANALANAAVTVRAGATFEARSLSGSASGAVTFEPGSVCSVTTASDVAYPATVQVAASLAIADKSQVSFRLNGTYHTADTVTVNESAGTITFADNGTVAVEGVTWRTDCTEGVWQESISTPWQDGKAYLNGAAVTFGSVTGRAPEDRVQVSLVGVVRPGSITFAEGSTDSYVFKAGAEGAYLDASAFAASVPVGAGQRWELPISTGSATSVPSGTYITLGLFGNQVSPTTYRLIPGNGTVIQTGSNAAAWHFSENGAGSDSFTWLLKPGETQSVGMFQSQMNGSGCITVTGGGTLSAEGQCQGTNWNGNFSGYFELQEGSTLDFLMNRGNNEVRGDQSPFFSALDLSRPAFVLTNGATLRFSGCRGILGGEQNVTEANRVPKTLISLGYNATVEYNAIFDNRVQIAPHSFLLKGNGATLSIGDVTSKTASRRGLCLPKGATIAVAGIGDEGDPADPATQPESGDATAPYALQRGITATIAAEEGTGLACWNGGVLNADGITLKVGQGSNLCVTANFVAPEGAAATIPLIKTGLGRLQLDNPAIATQTLLTVREGTVGGSAAFTNLDSQLVMMDGTTIEGGLALAVLDFRGNATLALDPTGQRPLTAEAVAFASGKQYTVVPLAAEIAEAQRGQAAIRVMGWRGATNLSAVNFSLAESLREKGYGLEVREDGLYLMKSTVYVREVDFGALDPANPLTTYTLAWFSPTGWYRQDDPAKTPRDYDPEADEATTVLFVLPEAFDPSAPSAMTPPHLTLQLNRAAAFAEVRFAAKHTEGDVVTFKPLTVGVSYHYNLTGEEMPAANESRRFMWVPTLVVTRADDSLAVATLTASVPAGYSATQSDATVVVYASAAQPAINLNFTGKLAGDASWVGMDAAPCGAVPFSGIYWNNLSTTIGAGSEYIAAEGGYQLFRKNAAIAGMESSEEGVQPTVAVTYLSCGAGRVASRRGDANSPLAAGYFKASRSGSPTALLTQGNLSTSGCWSGWQLRIDEVPFATYDLYLLFAGEEEGPTDYSTIRIKLGEGRWQTFGFVNGWTAPVEINDVWAGTGGLVKGAFVDGKNMLHLRIAATAGTDLQIAPADSDATEDSWGRNGLAAIQIIRCEDGAEMLRVGAGDWSDATGWQRLTDRERWVDSTLEAPRAARIPTVTELSADMLAAVPYLRFSGTSTMQMTGSAGVLSIGAIDLFDLSAGSFVDFTEDLFSQPPNVVVGPNATFAVPEATAGTVTNEWRWVYDWRANAAPYTATLRKSKAGDLVLTRRMDNNLQIDDGTLWIDTTRDGSFTYGRTISGEGGTLGKRGSGKLELGGTFSLASQRPIHLSGGELQWKLTNVLPAGCTIVIDGGILTYDAANSEQERTAQLPDSTVEISNGGIFRCGGINKLRTSIPTFFVTGAGSAVEANFVGNEHPHFGPVTLRDGAELRITGPANAAYAAYNHQGFVLHGSLCVESGDCAIVLSGNKPNGLALSEEDSEIIVADGATLTSNAMVSGVNLSGDAPRKLTKQGAGTWIQTVPLAWRSGGNSGATFIGTPMDIKGGTFRYRLGGAEHTMSSSVSDAPFTIYEGGRFEGSVTLPVASPVVVLKGGTLAPWLNDVKKSGMSIGKLTCEDGAVLDFDLANTNENTALTVPSTGSVSFTGTLTVRLSNLPATLTEARKLTNFQVQPTGSPAIVCPEAVALDAKVVLETRGDGETISNLWLVPSGASYIWANQSGNWADAAWTLGSEANKSFPYHATSTETTPVARIQATSADVALAVNGQNGTTNGTTWLTKGLVFSINEGRTATLTESLSTPVATSDTLNRLCVDGALWKIGKGTTTLSAPVELYGMGTDGTLNVAGGTLTLTHPFLSQSANADTSIKRTQLPLAIEVAAGSTLRYALKPLSDYSAEEQGAISGYDPAEQVLTGALLGSGTLDVAGATKLTLKGAVSEGAVNYAVRSGASLTLANEIPVSALAAKRTATVEAGGTLAATTATAFGSAEWTLTLGADATAGAMVQTSANAAFRGTLKLTGTAGTATFGTATGTFDGDVAFEVPAGTELTLGGSWSGGQGTVGSFTKRGTGALAFTGTLMANYPMTIAEGTVRFTGTGSVFAPDDFNESATQADWVVEPGATLAFDAAAAVDTNGGSLTFRNGATFALANGGAKFTGPVTFENGAAVVLSGVGQPTTFNSAVTLNGTVAVNLDALDPATLGNAGQAVYTLFTLPNDLREGVGTFQLAGSKLVEWTQAGWTLTDRGGTVTLEAFGGTAGAYTWAGDADATGAGNWQQKARWVAPHATDYSLWPEDVTNPAVLLQDVDPLATGSDLIPAAARTLDWSGSAQTLGGLRCNNTSAPTGESPDYTLTAKAAGATLTLAGDLLKSGDGRLVIERPLAMSSGAIKLLGGETLFKGVLKATTGDFNKPVTLGGNATLAFESTAVNYALKGLLTGDGTGKIRFNGTGTLAIANALDEVESLTIERGTVTLQAADQMTVAPRVTLADGATLSYAPSMLKAGGPVTMAINATDGAAPAGTLLWRATASNETAKAPVLAAPADHAATVPALNIQALTYWPLGGHLVVNPGQKLLPATVALTLSNSSAPTTALWVGAENPAADTLTVAKIAGAGRIGVEPRIEASAGAWATTRTLTLAPIAGADDFTFGGTFAGGLADDGTAISLGLTVTAPADAAAPRVTLSGDSTDDSLGTLTLGERTHVEVSGTWAGDVAIASGAKLSGSGTVGATGRTVQAPAGAKLAATVFGSRQLANGTLSQEVIPATLTVAGTLDMKPHVTLETMIRQDYATGKPWVSCIQVETLQLPLFLDDADNNVVSLDVVIDDEPGVVASNVKVLGWNTLSGISAISGRVLNPDGTERTDYFLRKRDDGLYLQRSNARFWLFIR